MTQAEQALTVKPEGSTYFGAYDHPNIRTIHFTQNVTCIYFDDGSVIVIDVQYGTHHLGYRADGTRYEVTP